MTSKGAEKNYEDTQNDQKQKAAKVQESVKRRCQTDEHMWHKMLIPYNGMAPYVHIVKGA